MIAIALTLPEAYQCSGLIQPQEEQGLSPKTRTANSTIANFIMRPPKPIRRHGNTEIPSVCHPRQ